MKIQSKLLLMASLSILALGHSALAKETEMFCVAEGTLSSDVGRAFVNGKVSTAKVNVKFTDMVNEEGLRELKNFHGTMKLELTPRGLDNILEANFMTQSLIENENYRPIKYKGYTQFPELRAESMSPTSVEKDMRGNFVMSKVKRDGTAKAYYIFQAGDHHGGTVPMDCYKVVHFFPTNE